MKTIAVEQLCMHYDIPHSFIDSLTSFEFIELIEIESEKHVQINDIQKIEKMMRLHYDLQVNFEGLDIINHLTSQIYSLQEELIELRNRLEFYS